MSVEETFITGNWASRRVWIGNTELLPGASQKVWNHSPDGFNWSFGGSGPAQLALAILLEVTHDERFSVMYHQAFKWAVIGRLPKDNFKLPLQKVRDWIEEKKTDNADPS